MQNLANYSLLTRFPLLRPNLSIEPPVLIFDFWKIIKEENPSIAPLIQAILLSEEIKHLEQIYAGYFPKTAVMVSVDILTKWPKNTHLAGNDWPSPIASELLETWNPKIWQSYFSYAMQISQKYRSSLGEWLVWDWQIKYGFLQHRLENIKSGYSWLEKLCPLELDADQQQIIAKYYKNSDPWQAEFDLDLARWQKIAQLSKSFSFDNDELVTYTLHLLLLERWWFISQSKENIFSLIVK